MPEQLKITYSLDNPPYCEVTASDGRWWSVALKAADDGLARYVITNERGRVLDEFGPTGRKLLAAVRDHYGAISHV